MTQGRWNRGRRWPFAIQVQDGIAILLGCSVPSRKPRAASRGFLLRRRGCHLTDLREDIFRGVAIGAIVFLAVALIIGLIGYWFAGPATISPLTGHQHGVAQQRD